MNELIPIEIIENKILLIREHKVMLDSDLAALYDVPTKRLNEQVRRNLKRFPLDFMFQLSKEEFDGLKSQIVTSSWCDIWELMKSPEPKRLRIGFQSKKEGK